MPDDLLRYVIGPAPVSAAWTWLAAALLLAVVGWYAAVFAITTPRTRTDRPGLVATARESLLRRRVARDVRRIVERRRAGELTDAQAGAALSGALRGFLQQVSGLRARYMQVDEIAGGDLAPAAPILSRLNDVQFNDRSTDDVDALGTATEELILSWS